MALAWIPRGILSRLQNLCYRFLWKGNQPRRIFSWTSWDSLALPKSWGGWGIKRLGPFSQALASKLKWQLLNNDSLWTKVATSKYIHPVSVLDWIKQDIRQNNISIIYKAVNNLKELIRSRLTWRIRFEAKIQIGTDPWMGCGNAHTLSNGLRGHLQENGITHINQIADGVHSTILHQAWKSATAQNIPRSQVQEWNNYTNALSKAHIRITDGEDELIWAHAKHGKYSPKEGYLVLLERYKPLDLLPWWKHLWKLKVPPQKKLLMWSILHNKVSTGAPLMKRSYVGPFQCHLYKSKNEDIEHLFLHCLLPQELWNDFLLSIYSGLKWQGPHLLDSWNVWYTCKSTKLKNVPLLISWAIQISKNQAIFLHRPPHWPSIFSRILADYNSIPDEEEPLNQRNIIHEPIDHSYPWAYFDDSTQERGCRGGAILHLSNSHVFKIQMGLGRGTNNFSELVLAKKIIHFALSKNCKQLQLFGDSQIICNWLNKSAHCNSYSLQHILDEAHRLITLFDIFSCHHIYRECNIAADSLSKEAALRDDTSQLIMEERDRSCYHYFHRSFIDLET